MADNLSARQKIERWDRNEGRANALTNDPDGVGYYTTEASPSAKVETYPHFIKRIGNEVDGLVTQAKNAASAAVLAASTASAAAEIARQSEENAYKSSSSAKQSAADAAYWGKIVQESGEAVIAVKEGMDNLLGMMRTLSGEVREVRMCVCPNFSEDWGSFSDPATSSEDWGSFSDPATSTEDWGSFTS